MISHCCKKKSKFKPVTHVIFDLDGTLIDAEQVYDEAIQTAIEAYGKHVSPDLYAKITGRTDEDGGKMLLELLNIDATIEDYLKIFNDYANKKLGDLDLMPGAERLVKHLYNNKIPIAIATSSTQESYDLKTKKYEELFSLFNPIVCWGNDPDLKAGKPAPDIFLVCASRFSDAPDPSKCLVFEDSLNGVKAARAAGMQVVMTPDDDVPHEMWKLATLRLDSLEYMMPQLFGLPPFMDEHLVFEKNLENACNKGIKH